MLPSGSLGKMTSSSHLSLPPRIYDAASVSLCVVHCSALLFVKFQSLYSHEGPQEGNIPSAHKGYRSKTGLQNI